MAVDPISPPGSDPVIPYQHQRGKYAPEVGHRIIVDLPGEKIQCEIRQVYSRDSVLVELLRAPMSPRASTMYGRGDIVVAQRGIGEFDLENWRVITEAELRQQQMRAKLEADEQARLDAEAEERVLRIRERDLALAERAAKAKAEDERRQAEEAAAHNWSA